MDLRELTALTTARHPWETARARFFCRLAVEASTSGKPLSVLDVGAGDGFVARGLLSALPAGSRVTCFDVHYTAEHLQRFGPMDTSGPGTTGPNTSGLSFCNTRPAERFDLVLLLDVLEHVPDDLAFLRSLVEQCVAPGGAVLVSVPAHRSLFSLHDVALGHHRRYSRMQLDSTLRSAGLVPVKGGGLFHSLLAPRALTKLSELARGKHASPESAAAPEHATTDVGQWRGGVALTALIGSALALDNTVSTLLAGAGLSLPGLSVWALCRKADT